MLAGHFHSRFPENPEVTRALMLLAKGRRQKAKDILLAQGFEDAEYQIVLVEGFFKKIQAAERDSASRKHIRIQRRSGRRRKPN